jgi:hypothetical protein
VILVAVRQFGESVTMNYAPEGLSYQLEVSLTAIEPSKILAMQQSKLNIVPDQVSAET